MPYDIRKRSCKQADGKKGKYVVVKKKSKGKTEQESCHTSKDKAKGAVRARYASEANESIGLKVSDLRQIIEQEVNTIERMSEGLRYHVSRGVGVDRNIFRPESDEFFALFREARELNSQGLYPLLESERELIEETDIGEFGIYEGEKVPLDFPMLYEEDEIEEAKYKGREVKLGAKGASRIGGGRARVYTRDPKSGKVVKVEFGSPMSDAMGDSDKDKARRKSYGARHNCADKKDKTKPGYWSCRATKMFGRNISGWW